MDTPAVFLALEDPTSGQQLSSPKFGPIQLRHVTASNTIAAPLRITRSFVTAEIEISLPTRQSSVSCIWNGFERLVNPSRRGVSFRVPLTRDLDYHLLGVVVDGRYAITIPIEVVHHYNLKSSTSAKEFAGPKWTMEEFVIEFQRLRNLFKSNTRAQIHVELPRRSLVRISSESKTDRALAVHQTVLALARFIMQVPRADLVADFAVKQHSGIDVQAIIRRLKSNIKYLQPDVTGPIVVDKKRYTTAIMARKSANGSALDLSDFLACLQLSKLQVLEQKLPIATAKVLEFVMATLGAISRTAPIGPSPVAVVRFISGRMQSNGGNRVQHLIRELLQLLNNKLSRQNIKDDALLGLLEGVRDFDLFERSVYVDLARAIGYSQDEAMSHKTLAHLDNHVINGNAVGAKSHLDLWLKGWRQSSVQPSDYRPDILVIIDGKFPILVDAKFRIGNSLDEVASAEAIKDIQAYLDEYSLPCAIIVTPLIPKGLIDSCINGIVKIAGGRRLVMVVEKNSSQDSRFEKNILNAIEACAEHSKQCI